jgi:glutaredoxin 3
MFCMPGLNAYISAEAPPSANRPMPRVTIYTRPFCGYCTAAKKLLRERGVDFEEIDVSAAPERRKEMIERSGRFTFPQIFVGARHVGGCDDLYALTARGGLESVLAA